MNIFHSNGTPNETAQGWQKIWAPWHAFCFGGVCLWYPIRLRLDSMKYVRMLRSVGGQGDAATGLATCHVGMDQYLLIPFLGGWTSIYQLFWCELQGYKVLTHCHVMVAQESLIRGSQDPNVQVHCQVHSRVHMPRILLLVPLIDLIASSRVDVTWRGERGYRCTCDGHYDPTSCCLFGLECSNKTRTCEPYKLPEKGEASQIWAEWFLEVPIRMCCIHGIFMNIYPNDNWHV